MKCFKHIKALMFSPKSFESLNERFPDFLNEITFKHPKIEIEFVMSFNKATIPKNIIPFVRKIESFGWQIDDLTISSKSDFEIEDTKLFEICKSIPINFTDIKIEQGYLQNNIETLKEVK